MRNMRVQCIRDILDSMGYGGTSYEDGRGGVLGFLVTDVMGMVAVVLVEETGTTPTLTKIFTFGCAGSNPAKGINVRHNKFRLLQRFGFNLAHLEDKKHYAYR